MKKNLFISFTVLLLHQGTAQTWTPLSVGSAAQVFYMSFPENDTGYVSMGGGTLRKTTNGALSWSQCTAAQSFITPLDFVTGTKGFCFGTNGLAMTTDGAQTWNTVLPDSGHFQGDVFCVNQSVIYAGFSSVAGDTLFLYRSVNGGTTWTLMSQTWMAVYSPDLYFISADTGFVNAGEQILKTTNGGVTRSTVYTDPNSDMITYFNSPDGMNVYCTTQMLQFLVSTNGGDNWAAVGGGNPLPAYGINFIGAANGFVCGGNGISSGYIDQTLNGGLTWTNVYAGNSLYCMDFPSTSVGYAAGENGVIVKYTGPTAVNETSTDLFSVYPNPVTEILIVENIAPGSLITITNSLGEIIFEQAATSNRLLIDVSDLAAGIYFCQVISDGKRSVEQGVIQK